MRQLACIIAIVVGLASCGPRPSGGGSDGGAGDLAGCAIPVGGVPISTGDLTAVTDNTLACTGTVNGQPMNCGSGSATLKRVSCSDGYAFTLVSGDATLTIRIQTTGGFSAGAEFAGGPPLTGDLTLLGVGGSGLQPPAGTVEKGSFVLQGTGAGQGIVANGTLLTTW